MSTTQPPNPAYTLEHAQQDIADLRGKLALQQDIVSTVSDKALLLYAPDQHAIPRGPTSWSFEDGTVQGWTAAANGAVTNSAVTAAGWPTDGSKSLLLTANGSGQPQASSSTALGTDTTGVTSFVPSQPGDPVAVSVDIYCPAGLNNVYCGIKWRDDTGVLISEVDCPDTVFTAGQVKTLAVAATAPDLTAGFAIVFGDHHTDANGTLIYGDNIKVQGNIAVSISPGGGTDPVGNPYPAGVKLRGPAQVFSLTSGDAAESTAGTVLAGTTGSGTTRQAVTEVFSPALGAGTTASLALISQSAGGTILPTASLGQPLSIGGTLTLSEQAGAPATPTGAGVLYVDATGHLRYLGPSGTNTLLANP